MGRAPVAGLAVDAVYAVGSYALLTLAPDGSLLGRWGQHGAGPGRLDSPGGVAIDATGAVYIADT